MKILSLVFIICCSCLQAHASVDDCISKNSYITLGDSFTEHYSEFPEKVHDHIWTVGFITQGEYCEKLYEEGNINLQLTSYDSVNVRVKLPWLSNYYEYMYDDVNQGYSVVGAISGDQYIRRSYHFRITYDDLLRQDFWQISVNGELRGRRYQFPMLSRYRHEMFHAKLRMFVVSDMDNSINSVATINKMISIKDWYDIIIHNGNFAYNIEDDVGMRGDDFFDSIQEAISTKPYIITPGNHENFDDGKFFNFRFRMPGLHNDNFPVRNHFYSFDVRKTHFTIFNMDYYYELNKNSPTVKFNLLKWVHDDLEKSHHRNQLFRVAITHRPIICGDPKSVECNFKIYYAKPFEELLRKQFVDFVLTAHQYDYTRLFKMQDFQNITTSTLPIKSKKYISPTYVISGHSGNAENFPETNSKDQISIMNQRYITGRNPNFLQVEINNKEIIASLHDCKTEEIQDFFMVVSRSYDWLLFGYSPGFTFAAWKLAFWIVIVFLSFQIITMIISLFCKKRKQLDTTYKNMQLIETENVIKVGKNTNECEVDPSILLKYIDNEENSELHFLDDQLNGNYSESMTLEYFADLNH